MPRSSFSRNPLLRVSRPVSACSRCRVAKVKCDGKLPACTACEKAGRANQCSSANDLFARGKERSYVAALELRIEKLERRLDYAISRKASVAQHDGDANPHAHLTEADRRNSLAVIRAAIHRKAARNRENSDVNSLVSDFSILSVDATTRDFGPNLGTITFARLVLAATSRDPLPKNTKFSLPPRQTATALVEHFMTHVYVLIPFFYETALFNILDDVYCGDDRVIKDADYWTLYFVLAIASASQSLIVSDEHYCRAVDLVSQAMTYADRALAPGYTTQIQSLLLLTLYSMLDPAHFDPWHLIGLTASAVIDLGLHQDPPSTSVSDRSALEMRRKIFYSTYAVDRAISMAHARPFSFTDESVNVAFPKSNTQSADPALLLFSLRRAQSFWYQVLHHSEATPLPNPTAFLWQMCQDMREWQASLPASLPSRIRELFDQDILYSYVYCLAPSRRVPEINDYIRLLMFEYIVEYMDKMHACVSCQIDHAMHTYYSAFKVYFMASQFLAVLRDARPMLLSESRVAPPPVPPNSPPAPTIPQRRPKEKGMPIKSNLERSLQCLQLTIDILDVYGARWPSTTLLAETFKNSCKDTVEQLQGSVPMGRTPARAQHSPFSLNGQSMSPPPGDLHMALQRPGPGPAPASNVPWGPG